MKNINKHCKTLELDKILQMLSEHCASDDAKAAALEICPETALEKANAQMKQTEDAYILTARFGSPSFIAVKNVSNPLRRAQSGGVCTMGELLNIAGVLRSIRQLLEWRSHSDGLDTSLDRLFERLCANKFLEQSITSAIVSEEEMSDNASPELFNIRRKMIAAGSKIREKLDSMIHSATYQKYLQDPVVTQRDGRYVVPVKAEFRSNVAGLVHDTSASGSTVFIEPMAVVEANNEIKVLKGKEAEEIERILFELSASCADFGDSIIDSVGVMVQLDLIFAKAKLAFDMKASVPLLNDDGITELHKARHPLLDKRKVVPIDVSLGINYDTLIITGPNTGGKTVTIKTLGLITLMAMCGLMIPCGDNSRVAVYRHIFADIGDEQSIEQSLSTFSSHMKNIIDILGNADDNSLVLLDELCSGTDPVEGAALAAAIIERLRQCGAHLAATTHYAELKAYALDTDGVENACCEFDVQTLSPTYRLLIGVPGKSNAFAISQRLGLSDDIIGNAKSMVSAEDNRFERVTQELEKSRIMLENERKRANDERMRAQKAANEAQAKLDELKTEYNRQIESAKEQARIIADNARVEVNRILAQMEQAKKDSKTDISKARAAAKKSFARLDKLATDGKGYDDKYTLPRPLKVGDLVKIPNVDTPATVLQLGDKQITVQAGIMKCKINIDDVRLVEDNGIRVSDSIKRRQNSYKSGIDSKVTRSASMELDIRGMNVEEATLELDKFIDNALINGQTSITIIHGKGTGALRAGVQSYLKRHKSVRTYRLGVFGEGESGVTIAELK